jgi:outer membrane immunogenic protein
MMKTFATVAVATILLSSAASAADLGSPRTSVAAAIAAPSFSWTGFYGGFSAGLGLANTNLRALSGGALPGSATAPVFGLQLGYNHQINSLVLGVEADAFLFRASRFFDQGPTRTRWQTSWDASIRARLGYAVDRTLLYVTGGVSFADMRIFAANNGVIPVGGDERQTRVGWTVGAGVEHAFTPNWTGRIAYQYANYGSRTLFGIPGVRLDTHKVTVGVNYLFSTGPSAVVARY